MKYQLVIEPRNWNISGLTLFGLLAEWTFGYGAPSMAKAFSSLVIYILDLEAEIGEF